MRRVDFLVHIESNGVRETVYSESVHRHQAGRWLDKEVDLGAWADSTVDVILETSPPARFKRPATDQDASALSQYHTLWANPVLVNRSPAPARKIVLKASTSCP